jgi:hypothetical protein
VHGCRAAGLHRLARDGVKLVRGLRDLHGARPEFTLGALTALLKDLLLCGFVITQPALEAPERWIGAARRTFAPVGNLRLWGLFTEPVIAGTGHAGVVTVLCDARGRLWSAGDVLPGPASRARYAYDATAALVPVSHRQLGREGAYVQGATASEDGRLGAGAGVQAVRAGPSAWTDEASEALWTVPLARQLDRAHEPGGRDLMFVTATVLGADRDALRVRLDGLDVRLTAPSDHPELAYRDNLRMLARGPGLRLRLVARLRRGPVRALAALAAGPVPGDEGTPVLVLPPEWAGRLNLGLDRLQSAHVRGVASTPVELRVDEAPQPDPLEPLRRRLERLVLGGRGTLPPEALAAGDREIASFECCYLPTAGAARRGLTAAALPRGSGASEGLALAWLSAATYERAATGSLWRAAWDG